MGSHCKFHRVRGLRFLLLLLCRQRTGMAIILRLLRMSHRQFRFLRVSLRPRLMKSSASSSARRSVNSKPHAWLVLELRKLRRSAGPATRLDATILAHAAPARSTRSAMERTRFNFSYNKTPADSDSIASRKFLSAAILGSARRFVLSRRILSASVSRLFVSVFTASVNVAYRVSRPTLATV